VSSSKKLPLLSSLRNNPEGHSSQLICSRSLKSRKIRTTCHTTEHPRHILVETHFRTFKWILKYLHVCKHHTICTTYLKIYGLDFIPHSSSLHNKHNIPDTILILYIFQAIYVCTNTFTSNKLHICWLTCILLLP
jgi:hypothetical protein